MWSRGSNRRWRAGFTIIEMVVVTTIFVMVTGIILANLPKFRNRASLDLTAQEVALSIREAQVFGIATRVAGDTYPAYGIHFSLDNGPDKKFILFADRGYQAGPVLIGERNNFYDHQTGVGCNESGEGTECLEEYTLDGQFAILSLCASASRADNCYDNNVALDLVYTRPFPEPSICLSVNGIDDCDLVNAYVVIGIPGSGETRNVIIWNNGQITATSNGENTP